MGSTIALAVGLTVAMTVSIVAVALAVIAATAEGSGSVSVSSNASQINMMRGMFAGVVPAEKQGPLCDACVGIFEQVNELLNDPLSGSGRRVRAQLLRPGRLCAGGRGAFGRVRLHGRRLRRRLPRVHLRRGKTARRGLQLPRGVPLGWVRLTLC